MPGTPAKHTLGRQERLKHQKQIDQLFAEGKGFMAAPIRVSYLLQPLPADAEAQPPLLAGFGAAKRHLKLAVHRNRAKRLLREAYRQHKTPLAMALQQRGLQLWVFFVHSGKELAPYAQVEKQMRYCLKRLAAMVAAG